MSGRLSALVAAAASLGAGVYGGLQSQPPGELVFLSVGQGDCAVFRHGGATALIDVGPKTGRFDGGERLVLPKLRSLGVGQVDLILLSHPDSDHIGGLPAVVRRFPRARVASPATFQSHPELLGILREAKVKPESVLWLHRYGAMRVGGYDFQLACLTWRKGTPDNDGSLFIRISNGASSAVLTGDAGAGAEAMEAARGDWRADVLKAGHHGSKTSTSSLWLSEVRPSVAVVSCGRSNRYGHPHREILDRLSSHGIKALRTDQQGDVRFVASPSGFKVTGR